MGKDKWNWDLADDQDGRVAVVTGANSGIGFEAARALVLTGARVVLACRDEGRGRAAVERLEEMNSNGSAELALLDLSSLGSVRRFAEGFIRDNERLDLLINNAGVMMPPASKTEDGFELQLGTNHLGHFALTGLLLPLLLSTEGARVVNVSSMAHRAGAIDFDDLHWERKKYRKWASYGQSKLANLLFTFELQRRLERAGARSIAVAAHPGWTATDLHRHFGAFSLFSPVFAMKPWQGALPTLRAALDPAAAGGDYYGPDGMMEVRGYPVPVGTTPAARDEAVAARLWEVSEELTGVRYEGI
jgi:NAD(P)-dependent dehydrogenase (short-subunit alcohol dehydrogenase family)